MFFTFSSILSARPLKRKNSSGDNINNNHRWRKVKARFIVPPGTQVIDLVNDIHAGSVTMNSVTTLALPSVASLQYPPPTSNVLPQSCLTQQELASTLAIIPSPIATIQVSSLTHSSLFKAPSTFAYVPVHSNVPGPSPNSPNLLLSLPPLIGLTPSDETLPSQAMAGENAIMPSNKTPPSQVMASKNAENNTMENLAICASGTPEMETALGEQGAQVQPRQIKYLSQTTC
jgi:hypothetical protein